MINQENNDLYDLNEVLKIENLTIITTSIKYKKKFSKYSKI